MTKVSKKQKQSVSTEPTIDGYTVLGVVFIVTESFGSMVPSNAVILLSPAPKKLPSDCVPALDVRKSLLYVRESKL